MGSVSNTDHATADSADQRRDDGLDPEKHSADSFYELSGTGVDLADVTAGFIANGNLAIESYKDK